MSPNSTTGFDPQQKINELFERFQNTCNPLESSPLIPYRPDSNDPAQTELAAISEELAALDKLWPNQGAIFLLQGHLASTAGDLNRAITAYEAAINAAQSQLTNDGYEPLFALGTIHFHNGNFAEATLAWGQCLAAQEDVYKSRVDQVYTSFVRGQHPLVSGIVEVYNQDCAKIGTGFLISSSLLITCAHVVDDSGSVLVRFSGTDTFLHVDVLSANLRTDISILRLRQSPPKSATVLKFGSTKDTINHRFFAYGFPNEFRLGLWATGTVVGMVKERGYNFLQLRTSELTHGFSGGPIWDDEQQKVIGVAARITWPNLLHFRLVETAFAVPIEDVKKELDYLNSETPGLQSWGCFIATAAFGDVAHPAVDQLRDFRDDYLNQCHLGRVFIKLYYRCSPIIARWLETRPVWKKMVRIVINFFTSFLPQRSNHQ